MSKMISSYILVIAIFTVLASAYLTHEAMNNITQITREELAELKKLSHARTIIFHPEVALSGANIETAVATAIGKINVSILNMLEMSPPRPGTVLPSSHQGTPSCDIVIDQYDHFLYTTVQFVRQIQIAQEESAIRWTMKNPVYTRLSSYQLLWASRRPNNQDRSFIEQQLDLYRPTGCFCRINRQILRKDVEVVEYINDLLDEFEPME